MTTINLEDVMPLFKFLVSTHCSQWKLLAANITRLCQLLNPLVVKLVRFSRFTLGAIWSVNRTCPKMVWVLRRHCSQGFRTRKRSWQLPLTTVTSFRWNVQTSISTTKTVCAHSGARAQTERAANSPRSHPAAISGKVSHERAVPCLARRYLGTYALGYWNT